MTHDALATVLPTLLLVAWLLPLASFVVIVLAGPKLGKAGYLSSYVATGAIVSGFVLSMIGLVLWLGAFGIPAGADHHGEEHHAAAGEHDAGEHGAGEHWAGEHGGHEEAAEGTPAEVHPEVTHGAAAPEPITGNWYTLGTFGGITLPIGYYIDSLTVCMFCMVTLIASCIHFYSIGYMHEELEDVTDHEVKLVAGQYLVRRGRFYRFFQYLSLFSFSMLGLVVSGNIFMTFVFWELVGICSYFLIGFYIERKSASTAANKAFIVNRVGDLGMLVGIMAIVGTLGTFQFGDMKEHDESGQVVATEPGIFSQVRPAETDHALVVPDGMVIAGAAAVAPEELAALEGAEPSAEQIDEWREGAAGTYGHWLLIIAGLGIFCGCVGKSAQFPLHTWLPDAMEGPTPVSALVHSATMVAAGVFLVGRFFPVFTAEVLLVIAIIGCVTLFIAATIAITATDIKRVLAYSTISQLGYMMLGLGVGGWAAGMLHLFTHAFFKSLLFMCSGSVIHAVHSNEMTDMGGLRKKMPWTAYTMLVGCLAIAGAGLPFAVFGMQIGLSGYYSKDAILAQTFSFGLTNPIYQVLFFVAAAGAAITAFYMFRLWYMTFAGEPRDHHRYDHAHESPKVMYVPLVILAVFAVGVAWHLPFTDELSLPALLSQSEPAGPTASATPGMTSPVVIPPEAASHAASIHVPVTWIAFGTALAGFVLATLFYGVRVLNPNDVRQQFGGIYRFLVNKWWFDELYDAIFVRPVMIISRLVAQIDRKVIDWVVDGLAYCTRWVSRVDDFLDRNFVDGLVNWFAGWMYSTAVSLRVLQTGKLRQYVVFIVVATVAIFVLASFFWGFAGQATALVDPGPAAQ